MSSTYSSIHLHVVFSTKHRQPLIAPAWRPRLHAFVGGAIRTLEASPEAIGGVEDHVHLLIGLKPIHRVSDLVREVKKASSHWIVRETEAKAFAWQEGYAAFSVSASSQREVRDYIARQEEHHRKRSFREELVLFLERSGVTYDERYLD